jgi:hypothetical protein
MCKNGDYNGLRDLVDGWGNKINLSDFAKQAREPMPKKEIKPSLPDEYNGKKWDELYKSDQLEIIRKHHPEHYENLKNEKYKTIE